MESSLDPAFWSALNDPSVECYLTLDHYLHQQMWVLSVFSEAFIHKVVSWGGISYADCVYYLTFRSVVLSVHGTTSYSQKWICINIVLSAMLSVSLYLGALRSTLLKWINMSKTLVIFHM